MYNPQREIAIARVDKLSKDSGVIYFACSLIPFAIALVTYFVKDSIPVMAYYLINLIFPYFIEFLICLGFISQNHIRASIGFNFSNYKSYLFMIPVLVLFYPMTTFISLIGSSFIKTTESNESMMKMFDQLGLIPTLLLVAILPAIVEEFICRGIIFSIFRLRSFTCALVMSSLSFALLHNSFVQVMYAFFFGCVLATVREITGSFIVTAFLHFMFNAVSIVCVFYARHDSSMLINFGFKSVYMFAGFAVISTVLGFYMLYLMSKVFKHEFDNEVNRDILPFTLMYVVTWIMSSFFIFF